MFLIQMVKVGEVWYPDFMAAKATEALKTVVKSNDGDDTEASGAGDGVASQSEGE